MPLKKVDPHSIQNDLRELFVVNDAIAINVGFADHFIHLKNISEMPNSARQAGAILPPRLSVSLLNSSSHAEAQQQK
jgi:hypothetical protein